jgi:hypothetical protein
MPTVNNLVPQVQSRLEEMSGPVGDGELWSIQFELRTAIIEAMSDMMLLIGRPTQEVTQQFSLVPNTCFQTLPTGVFLLTDIYGLGGDIREVSLHDMDYIQSSWTSSWSNDTSPNGPLRWFPLGFNMFGVHPAASIPVTVTLTGIQYATTDSYPYPGTEPLIFHDELEAALEQYATFYCKLKETGPEVQTGMQLYKEYLAAAKRNTEIEDRRDPVIFSPNFGGGSGLDPLVRR